jgi:hypothetical protein
VKFVSLGGCDDEYVDSVAESGCCNGCLVEQSHPTKRLDCVSPATRDGATQRRGKLIYLRHNVVVAVYSSSSIQPDYPYRAKVGQIHYRFIPQASKPRYAVPIFQPQSSFTFSLASPRDIVLFSLFSSPPLKYSVSFWTSFRI